MMPNLEAEEEARKEAVRVGAALDKVKLPTTAAVYMACADQNSARMLRVNLININQLFSLLLSFETP